MTHMEFKSDFGIRIRELRHREGDMSLRELARRVGISPSYLSQIEQGKLPPPSNIFLIALFAQELNEDRIELAKLAQRPLHSLSDLLNNHPEIPNLLAEMLILMKQKSITIVLVSHCLQSLVGKEYGKYVREPDDVELSQLTDCVKKIHRYLKERNKKQ